MNFLKRWIFGDDATPAMQPARSKERDEHDLAHDICPECRSKGQVVLGPQGGSATNCMCLNCRHEWNLLLLNGVTILQDMGTASEGRASSVYGWTKSREL